MARDTFDYTHGDTGTKPSNALNFQENERPNAQHFDWYWYNAIESINGHSNEFDRLDNDNDGVVDAADGASTWSETGNLVETHPTDVNFSGDLQLSSDGDGTVTVSVTTYTDSDALTAVNNDPDHGSTASHNYFSGNHSDLAGLAPDNHHSRYTDTEAIDAVNGETTLSVDISGDADTLDGKEASFFTTLGEVNANADVPNADYADSAGNADTLDGNEASYFTTLSEVNANADVPNADQADNADRIDGKDVHVGPSAPSNPDTDDIWIETD